MFYERQQKVNNGVEINVDNYNIERFEQYTTFISVNRERTENRNFFYL